MGEPVGAGSLSAGAVGAGSLGAGAASLAAGAVVVEVEPANAAAIFGDRVGLAREYVAWLVGAGVEWGLIGPREADRVWSRHVLNCAVLAPLLPPDALVVDVGSGAGLPGIPLAIARPDCAVTLVEPLERRVRFLDEVTTALGLGNCRVVRGRADEVVSLCGGADVVTSRAVAPLARLAGWSVPLTKVGGEVLAIKGSSAAQEVDRDRAAVARLGLVELSVVTVGSELLDPPTSVIRGLVQPVGGRRSARRSR